MTTRTKRSTARFTGSFSLDGIDRMFPPGDYTILEDEELIEGISWLAYRRVGTFIEVPKTRTGSSAIQMVEIDAKQLAAMLEQDAVQSKPDATTGPIPASGEL